jgi:hypothetical protein
VQGDHASILSWPADASVSCPRQPARRAARRRDVTRSARPSHA